MLRFRRVGLSLLVLGLLTLGLHAAFCATGAPPAQAEEDAKDGVLEPAAAAKLVAEAASSDRTRFESLMAKGVLRPERLEAHDEGIPLTVAVLAVAVLRMPDEGDLVFSPNVTPRSLSEAFDPASGGKKRHARPSLIHEEYVTDTTVYRKSDDHVEGSVRFEAIDAYRGVVRFQARRIDGTWRVVELVFDKPRLRVTTQDGKRWKMVESPLPSRVNPLRGKKLRLPKVSQVGIEPPAKARIVLSVNREGSLFVPGRKEALSLAALETFLAQATSDPKTREADGSSAISVLLDVDEEVPWIVCQWLMQICASPSVQIWKIAFGARASDGAAGALTLALPQDRSLPVHPGAKSFRKLKAMAFSTTSGSSEPRELYAALLQYPEAERKAAVYELVTPPPKGGRLPWGYVAQLVDVMLRAGARQLWFEGAAMPRLPGGLPADPAWLRTQVLSARTAHASEYPRVKLGNTWVDEMGLAPKDLPKGKRVKRVVGTWPLGDGGGALVFEGPPSHRPLELPVAGAGRAFTARRRQADPESGDVPPRACQAAVQEGLRWLAAHQSPDGSWEAANFGDWCDGKAQGGDARSRDGKGESLYDVGVTGLALQAFLAAGFTNRGDQPYAKTVGKGLRYLKNKQDRVGCFGTREHELYMYNHAMAALAMVEAYGMTGSPIYKGSAQRAIQFCEKARNPYFAWRYGVRPGDNDTSISSWMTLVLRAARWVNEAAEKAGKAKPLKVDDVALEGMAQWLDKVTDAEYGRVGYLVRGSGPARPRRLVDAYPGELSESMTTAAIFCRYLLGQGTDRRVVIDRGLKLAAALPPTWNERKGSIDMYYWYWGTLAMWQAGGERWAKWEKAVIEALVDNQRTDGTYCEYRGSWNPVGVWGGYGGRVYATALSCLDLLVYRRYPRAE